ncbi:polymorphic toxin-type HINT domain-containing protein [Kutzneria sp. NPDC052558]|uniref:polymorphic toxin-type HINT domain-containing protein n=1 Tax=Kutzneria sp. NPDC052558 TaxID=3364121 RepID=UPI0037C77673
MTTDDRDFIDLSIRTDTGVEQIEATVNHPFWDVSTTQWTPAVDLKRGDTLKTVGGKSATVESVSARILAVTTYDLTVDSGHTYFVLAGAVPVLVHNRSACPNGVGDVFDRGSFDTPDDTFTYHYNKHGAPEGKTPEECLADAKAWLDSDPENNKGRGVFKAASVEGSDGVKVDTYRTVGGGPGGMIRDGKVISFWYR